MGAATRVEEAIGGAERVTFDLVPLLGSAVAAYRGAFPGREFLAELPPGPVEPERRPGPHRAAARQAHRQRGGFQPGGRAITVRLRLEPQAAVIEVENPGPPLPLHVEGRLFESLWQSRPDGDSRPHFGLGLYIVRLIAEFHGGEAAARNLEDGSGSTGQRRLAR